MLDIHQAGPDEPPHKILTFQEKAWIIILAETTERYFQYVLSAAWSTSYYGLDEASLGFSSPSSLSCRGCDLTWDLHMSLMPLWHLFALRIISISGNNRRCSSVSSSIVLVWFNGSNWKVFFFSNFQFNHLAFHAKLGTNRVNTWQWRRSDLS